MRLRTIIPLSLLVTLGAGVACKKPAPAPTVDLAAEEAKRKAEAEEARRKAEEDKRKAEAEAARLKQEEEAKRKAEAEEARRKAEADFQAAAKAALVDINFAFDKSGIRDEDKAKLEGIAEFMKKFAQANVKIEGHCDERGTVEYNLALGERRAAAAQAYLTNLGVAAGRLSTISFGKERPKVEGHSEASFLANRRAEFKLQ